MTFTSSASTPPAPPTPSLTRHAELDELNVAARADIARDPHRAAEQASDLYHQALDLGYVLGEADALYTKALCQHALGELKHSDTYAQQAAKKYLSASRVDLYCDTLLLRARVALALDQIAQTLELCGEIITLSSDLDLTPLRAETLHLKSMVLFRQGNYPEAIQALQHTADLRLEQGDLEGHAKCLNNLGLIYEALGDYLQALDHFLNCLEFLRAKELSLDGLLSMCLVNIGKVYRELGDLDKAVHSLVSGVEAAERAGTTVSIAAGHNELGLVYREQGEHKAALDAFHRALSVARKNGMRHEEAEILDTLGQTYTRAGEPRLARATFYEAYALATSLDDKPCQANVLIGLGSLGYQEHSYREAIEYLRQAVHLTETTHMKRQALEAHECLAHCLHATGCSDEAVPHYQTVATLQRELFRDDSERKLRKLTDQLELEKARHQADMYRQLNDVALQAKEQAEAEVRERTLALEQAQLEILTRLGIAAEYRDDKTGMHTYRVGHIAGKLAEALKLPRQQTELIRLAARLHDVGKIGVPDAVLLKPGKFTPEEFEIMKHHTTIGARVLQGGHSELMRVAEEIALSHHERWDGRGYPQGLSGTDIPLTGRLVAVADVWDALTTERSYKGAWTHDDARAEIEAQSGKQFDPDIVSAFLDLLNTNAAALLPDTSDLSSQHAELELGVPHYEEVRSSARPTRPARVEGTVPAHAVRHIDALIDETWQTRYQDLQVFQAQSRKALEIAEQHDYLKGCGYAHRNLGWAHVNLNDIPQAMDHLTRAQHVATQAADVQLERDCVNILGQVYASLHNTERAVQYCLQGLELSRKLLDPSGEAKALSNLGILYKNMESWDKAITCFLEAVQIAETVGNNEGLVNASYNLADAYLETANNELALLHGQRSLQVARATQNTVMDVVISSLVARAHDALGAWDDARTLHHDAWNMLQADVGFPAEVRAWTALYFGMGLSSNGFPEQAAELLDDARATAETHGIKRVAAQAHRSLAGVAQQMGALDKVVGHLSVAHHLDLEIYRQENSQRAMALMVEYQVERAQAEADMYKVRSVELASANVALEKASREKSALLAALQEQSRILERQLREDALTGVYNRRFIEENVTIEFERHRSSKLPMAILMVDIDHFKQINDRFSHPVGDEVLRRVARIFRDTCRADDLIGRYGGEEFLFLFPNSTLQQAAEAAERIRANIEHYDWTDIHDDLRVTLSLGICADTSVANHEKMISLADAKLYEAKTGGRNRVAK
ncbi:tetratricopeptide repeat protein (plasmid) [Deinococcus taeanensis]|uniref:tetratricopeptide repeat protein n=1 Tax=Deinococcus taeanensis TaxID=2737050 RepID=UPI001CDB8B3E|nr:tetratricopeptide repeat protein [Deinococcus taeanensis]UBV44346.1 tetratricopeptide repeat protein [Deinococcus taeanensis]